MNGSLWTRITFQSLSCYYSFLTDKEAAALSSDISFFSYTSSQTTRYHGLSVWHLIVCVWWRRKKKEEKQREPASVRGLGVVVVDRRAGGCWWEDILIYWFMFLLLAAAQIKQLTAAYLTAWPTDRRAAPPPHLLPEESGRAGRRRLETRTNRNSEEGRSSVCISCFTWSSNWSWYDSICFFLLNSSVINFIKNKSSVETEAAQWMETDLGFSK